LAAEADLAEGADAADTSTVILRIRILIAVIWSFRQAEAFVFLWHPRNRSLCYGAPAINLPMALGDRAFGFVYAP
jgi:hypothetical protein